MPALAIKAICLIARHLGVSVLSLALVYFIEMAMAQRFP